MVRRGPLSHEDIRAVVNLLQVASWLTDELEEALDAGAGLSHAEYEVMMQLLQHGSRLALRDLAELSLFSQSGITRLLDRLERKGLAARELSESDRRVVFAALTDQGRKRLEAAMPLVRRIMADRFVRHLSDGQVTQLRRILLAVIAGNGWLDERQVSHQPPPPQASQTIHNAVTEKKRSLKTMGSTRS